MAETVSTSPTTSSSQPQDLSTSTMPTTNPSSSSPQPLTPPPNDLTNLPRSRPSKSPVVNSARSGVSGMTSHSEVRPSAHHSHSNPTSTIPRSSASASSSQRGIPRPSSTPATSTSPTVAMGPAQTIPRSSAALQRQLGATTGGSAASSTTSVNMLAMSNAHVPPPAAHAGASRMAMAAKRGQQGRGFEGEDGIEGAQEKEKEDEDHPLSETSLANRGYHTIHTLNHLFHLQTRWNLQRPLGQGAYGLVISVLDTLSGETVAVKLITRVFDKVILARRALREITLLRHFGGHENLTGLIDLDVVWDGFNEIYLFMEPMEADLHQIVRSGQALTNPHIQYFMYQLLRGMKYIHSANVIHRDLKPGNLLVNSDCELKICDFGLARGYRKVSPEEGEQEMKLTEYVATRWYRAPEIMLSNRRYTTAIDVWSIGCILAELLGGKPIFKGKDYVDQVNLILGVLGTPDDETISRVGSEKAGMYIKTLPTTEPVDLATMYPDADPDAVDLLRQLLVFDPAKRIDVVKALEHPYLASYHDEAEEPSCSSLFDKWEQVESLETIEELREAIAREVAEYRAEVRAVDEEGEDSWAEEVDPITGSPEVAVASRLLGSSVGSDISPLARMVPLPRSSSSKTGDQTPPTPMSAAVSEESFGNPLSGRASRRTSATSMGMHHRRPSSFLFSSPLGVGMTPMAAPGAELPTHGHNRSRSRAPSSGAGEFIRPLLRQLSTVDLSELKGETHHTGGSKEEVPPMTVSPSDAPPSEQPNTFGGLGLSTTNTPQATD